MVCKIWLQILVSTVEVFSIEMCMFTHLAFTALLKDTHATTIQDNICQVATLDTVSMRLCPLKLRHEQLMCGRPSGYSN